MRERKNMYRRRNFRIYDFSELEIIIFKIVQIKLKRIFQIDHLVDSVVFLPHSN